ncbi:MAG: lysophospholipid acyltransferase family protein [Spirulinaceae cyanobacterium]
MTNKKNSRQKVTKSSPGWSLDQRDSQVIASLMPFWEWFYRYYFRVETDGWENIPNQGKFLFVGSHNGGLASPDMMMMMYDWFCRFGTKRLIYGLMHPIAWQVYPGVTQLAAKTGAIIAHPQMAIAALKKDASVLVYPGGAQDLFRPYSQRNKINFAGRKAFIKLALREEVAIIPAISIGAHDTLFILGDFYKQVEKLHQLGLPWILGIDPEVFPIYLGLPWGLSIGPLPNIPLPAKIHTRICSPIVFKHYGRESARNRTYVDECYNLVETTMQSELNRLSAEKE